MPLHVDLETRSALELRKVGVHRYAEDASTEIILGCAMGQGLPILAHNAQFERTLLNAYGAGLRPEDMDCTMARANALNLPGELEALGKALNAPIQKDKDGGRLMLKMCRAAYTPKPGEMKRLAAYCETDVLSESAVDAMLPPLSDFERKVWVLDQQINDRGFAVDVPVIERALLAVQEATRRADRKMWELTGGKVEKCSQALRIVSWLCSRGLAAESIAEGKHDELMIRCDLLGDELAREVIELRQATSKTFKFQSMLDTVCRDGRIRGTLVYQGAISGRWTGRIPQPHNMKRVMGEDARLVADALDILQQPMSAAGHVTAIEMLCGPPLDALSLCARAMIIAPKGKKLVGGDFSNIEGRINAWANGERWKVDAFKEYDAGRGPDLYRVMAGSILGHGPERVSEDDRQLWGKVPELACLGPDTLVITDRGPVVITEVSLNDRLWDGEEWVRHAGSVRRGRQETIFLNGVEMTPDHPVLLGETWYEAQTVASDPHWIQLASVIASGSLRSQAFRLGLRAEPGSLLCAAPALNLSIECSPATFVQANQLAAIVAQNARVGIGAKPIWDMPRLYPMTRIDAGCLTAPRHVFSAATIPVMRGLPTTESVELRFGGLGDAISALFSHTSQPWRDGITRAWSLIERMSTGATSPETSDLLLVQRTARTLARSQPCNDGLRSWNSVYDIALAGPRNRFTVYGTDGLLTVHNCGYQGGVNAFAKMGANYGVRVDASLARRIVNGWREANAGIVEGWADLQQAAIHATETQGMVVSCLGGRVAYVHADGFLWCKIPSGRCIAYPGALVERKRKIVVIDGDEVEFDNWGVSFWGQKGGWRKLDLYGGMQMAHVVSGIARDIMAEALIRLDPAYPVVLHVHDEALSEVDEDFGSADEYRRLMEVHKHGHWTDGLPITAKAWEDVRYVK